MLYNLFLGILIEVNMNIHLMEKYELREYIRKLEKENKKLVKSLDEMKANILKILKELKK